ncbi:hypothetical protein BT63DRAFT_83344 [Microthyrium microscopicum]|uniref:Uncharacterized protein n=1 Tax=Microthyrium microscopicum TaxID=703497 RepID=A0A6A6TY83_9PEZI|nr:hypothetical protein BT63DRAFT_83344 [Microthyrium microscopicum]
MPGINGIYVELQCQQNLSSGGPIEEFAPRERSSTDPPELFMPTLYDRDTRAVSVFIPIFPKAQFFIRYQARAPRRTPPGKNGRRDSATEETHFDENLFYVYKLFIGTTEVTTWSSVANDEFQGHVSFALFDTSYPEIHSCGVGMQKRVFGYESGYGDLRVTGDLTSDKDEDRKIEIRVYRADQQMRVPKNPGEYNGQGMMSEVGTPSGGLVNDAHKKKYYAFGLLDPLNKPYSTFRFYYRSWEEIHNLTLRYGEAKDKESAAIFEAPTIQFTKDQARKTIKVNLLSNGAIPQLHSTPASNDDVSQHNHFSLKNNFTAPPNGRRSPMARHRASQAQAQRQVNGQQQAQQQGQHHPQQQLQHTYQTQEQLRAQMYQQSQQGQRNQRQGVNQSQQHIQVGQPRWVAAPTLRYDATTGQMMQANASVSSNPAPAIATAGLRGGSIVSDRRLSCETSASSFANNQYSEADRRFSADGSRPYQQHQPRVSSQLRHNSVQVSPALLLPPAHPHAQRLAPPPATHDWNAWPATPSPTKQSTRAW